MKRTSCSLLVSIMIFLLALSAAPASDGTEEYEEYMSLFSAALHSDVRKIKTVLKKGVDVNTIGTRGLTALYFAIMSENPAVVKVLLDAGADLNFQPSGDRMTPLEYARSIQLAEIVRLMEGYRTTATANQVEYWGAYTESGGYNEGYGLAWNYTRPDDALKAAIEECRKGGRGDYCSTGLYVFSTSLPAHERFSSGQRVKSVNFAGFQKVTLMRKRCILVTSSGDDATGSSDVVRMFYDSEDEARRAFDEEADGPNMWIAGTLRHIACNAR